MQERTPLSTVDLGPVIRMMEIFREPIRRLTLSQHRQLARLADEKARSSETRMRRAWLAAKDDDFEEVKSCLAGFADLSFAERNLLTKAYLSAETSEGNEQAFQSADVSVDHASSNFERAIALADRAKAERRLRMKQQARRSLDAAMSLDPSNKDACKRLAAMDLEEGRAAELVDRCAHLSASGVGHARLYAAWTMGAAVCGELATARATEGFSLLAEQTILSPPPGWADLAAFNAALAIELLNHRNMRFERYGSASNRTWRIEELGRPDAPLVDLLLRQIVAHLKGRIETLNGVDHPWLAGRPPRGLLRAWSVITEGDGYEGWHVHQFGWLSGVYYVQVPAGIVEGEGPDGCIAFGLPEDQVGETAAVQFGLHKVRPQPGLLLTFPSHTHHRTYPHGLPGRRICVAFDLRAI